jgi:hypothetical protein
MEQVKQSSLLDDAAFQFSKDNWNNQIERECSIHTVNQEAFKAGAQWQKEQDKELVNAAKRIMNYYYPNTYDEGHEAYQALKNAIEKHVNQS